VATRTGGGPIWFPINYLLIESLQQFHHYYGDDFKVECPTGSGQFLTLKEIANDLSNRLIKLWMKDGKDERPYELATRLSVGEAVSFPGTLAASPTAQKLANERHLFHEYFHGDTGAGLDASHQTGWTGLGETGFSNRASSARFGKAILNRGFRLGEPTARRDHADVADGEGGSAAPRAMIRPKQRSCSRIILCSGAL